jgi:hypothetical protein
MTAPIRRCAVYTRKSSEDGLESGARGLEAGEKRLRRWRLLERHHGTTRR